MRAVAACVVGLLLAVAADPCTHDFDTASYDLSSLQGHAPFSFAATGRKYSYAVCGALGAVCGGSDCVGVEQDVAGLLIYNLGLLTNVTWSLVDVTNVDAGVVVAHGGGSSYISQQGRWVVCSTTVNVLCDSTVTGAPANVKVTPPTDTDCALVVTLTHGAGCPSAYRSVLSPGWVFVILLLSVLVLYCGGGAAYKKCSLGTSGAESIPHIEFWRDVWDYVVRGWNTLVASVTCRERRGGDMGDRYYETAPVDPYEEY